MRAEIALIVIIAFAGVISQSKLFKVIKDRRKQQEAALLEDDRERDQVEEAHGRRLEEANMQERLQWERIYAERQDARGLPQDVVPHPTDRPRKLSTTIVGTREVGPSDEGVEMTPLSRNQKPYTHVHEVLNGTTDGIMPATQVIGYTYEDPN